MLTFVKVQQIAQKNYKEKINLQKKENGEQGIGKEKDVCCEFKAHFKKMCCERKVRSEQGVFVSISRQESWDALFPIPYSLFPVPCSPFPIPCSL